jgi:hypothetical protein
VADLARQRLKFDNLVVIEQAQVCAQAGRQINGGTDSTQLIVGRAVAPPAGFFR